MPSRGPRRHPQGLRCHISKTPPRRTRTKVVPTSQTEMVPRACFAEFWVRMFFHFVELQTNGQANPKNVLANTSRQHNFSFFRLSQRVQGVDRRMVDRLPQATRPANFHAVDPGPIS